MNSYPVICVAILEQAMRLASGNGFRSANLQDADLQDADLPGANLRGANLRGAFLQDADLQPIRADFRAVLQAAPVEVPALLSALRDGRVDGSTYEGECACLVGTIGNARNCRYDAIPGLRPDSSRPAERFFLGIAKGDTPATNQVSSIAEEWAVEWLAEQGAP